MSKFTYDKVEKYGADVAEHIKKNSGKIKAIDGKTYTLKISSGSVYATFVKHLNNANMPWETLEKWLTKNNFEVLKPKDRSSLGWTQIEKTVFSTKTKSGSKPSAANKTALAESAACIATAYLCQTGKDLTTRDLSTADSIKYLTTDINVVVDIGELDSKKGIKQILDWLKDNPDWLETSVTTAKILKQKLKLGKKHHFHRDSMFMKNIYTEATKHIKKLNNVGLKIGGDKWNPGDIWIADKGSNGFPATKDLTALNKQVAAKFKNADIMGVSLKKLGKAATWEVYNLKEQERNFRFDSIKKPAGDLMDSKDMYLVTKSGKEIQIRTFDTKNNIQAEIKGGSAAGGKAGFGLVSYAIKKIEKVDIDKWEILGKLSTKDKVKRIQKHYSSIFGSNVTEKKIIDSVNNKKNRVGQTYISWTKLQQDDYWASKIQALHICDVIKNSKQKNDLMTIIVAYAASLGLKDMFDASVYGKVF